MVRNLIAVTALLSLAGGCSQGTPKYTPPPKAYPTVFTFNASYDAVWDATLGALKEMGFSVLTADKAANQITTGWSETGIAPSRRCKYGFTTYWENPTRREQLQITIKSLGGGAATPQAGGWDTPPAAGPAAGGWGTPPAAQPAAPGWGTPPAAGQPGAAEGWGGLGTAVVPPVAQGGVMVVVLSKGESVLKETCGAEPAVVPIEPTDTTTEYGLLYRIGKAVGAQMEPPPVAN